MSGGHFSTLTLLSCFVLHFCWCPQSPKVPGLCLSSSLSDGKHDLRIWSRHVKRSGYFLSPCPFSGASSLTLVTCFPSLASFHYSSSSRALTCAQVLNMASSLFSFCSIVTIALQHYSYGVTSTLLFGAYKLVRSLYLAFAFQLRKNHLQGIASSCHPPDRK